MPNPPENGHDLIIAVRNARGLAPKVRSDLTGAVRAVARALGSDRGSLDAQLHALDLRDPVALDARLKQLRAHANASLKANESRFRAAVRHAGLPLRNGRGQLPLVPLWRDRLAVLSRREREILLPLVRFLSATGVDVANDRDAAAFAARFTTGKTRKSALQVLRRIVATWNSVCERLGLTPLAQPVPYAERDAYTYPQGAFAPQVRDELAAYRAAAAARLQSTKRRAQLETTVLRLLSASCRATGWAPEAIPSLTVLLEKKSLEAAIRFMIERAQQRGEDVTRTPGAYAALCDAYAFFTVLLGAEDPRLSALRDLRSRLTPGTRYQLSRRTQARITDAWHPTTIKALLRLPHEMYDELESGARPEPSTLTALTHACALGLLLRTGLSPSAVAALRLGETIVREVLPSGQAQWRVITSASPDRRGRAEIAVPEEISRVVETYVARIRPLRPGAASQALFPNRNGSAIGSQGLGVAIAKLTRLRLGLRIPAWRVHLAIIAHVAKSKRSSQLAMQFAGRRGHDADRQCLIATALAQRDAVQNDATIAHGRRPR